MAARVNVRFVLILVILLGAVFGGAGAYFIWFQEQTAEEHMAKAQELIAAGALKPGLQQLEAAIGKDPTNRDALEDLGELHARIVPQTVSEAGELYPRAVALANHYSVYFPDDPESHRGAIETLRSAMGVGPRVQAARWWELANDAAERMMRIEGDPDAVADGTVIHALWLAAPARGVTLDADRTDAQREEGAELITSLLQERPADDAAIAAHLDILRGILAERVTKDESARRVAEATDELEAALADAEAALDGAPEDAAGMAIRARIAQAMGWREIAVLKDRLLAQARSAGVGVAEAEALAEDALDRFKGAALDLRVTAERWAESVPIGNASREDVTVPEYLRVLFDATDVLLMLTPLGADFALVDIADHVRERPEVAGTVAAHALELLARASFARAPGTLEERTERFRSVRQAIDRIAAMPRPPMGADALRYVGTRRRALTQAVEIGLLQWEVADEENRSERLAAMRADLEALEAFIRERGEDIEEETDALYARGLVQFAAADTTGAASLLGRVAETQASRLDGFQRGLTLRLLSEMLTREGALARAAAALEESLLRYPNDPRSLARLAQLQLQLGRPAEAVALIDRLEGLVGSTQVVVGLRRAVTVGQGGESDDPIANAMARMNELEEAGRADEALALGDDLVAEPPAATIAAVHARIGDIAFRAGRMERARAAYQRAVDLQPGVDGYRARLAVVATEDPIEQAIEVAEASISDPVERAVRLADQFESQRAVGQRQLEAATDPVEREQLEIEIARFSDALQTQLETVRVQMGPGASATAVALWMDRLLREATNTDDWSDAEAFLQTVRDADLDRAGGAYAEGQLMLARARASTAEEERRAFYEQAAATLEEAVEFLPFSADVGRRLGDARRRLGRLEAATRAYADAVANDPGNASLVFEYAQVLVESGEPRLALEAARSGLARNPDNASLREYAFGLQFAQGDEGGVLLERRRIHRSEPGDLYNALLYAYLLLEVQPTYAMLVDDEGRPMINPGEWARMGAAGQRTRLAAERRRAIDEARGIIERVAERPEASSPDNALGLEILRAMAAEAAGDVEGAVRIVRAAVESADEAMRGPAIAAATGLLAKFNRYQDALTLLGVQEQAVAEPLAPFIDWTMAKVLQQVGRPDLAGEKLQEASVAAGGEPFTIFLPQFARLRISDTQVAPIDLARDRVQTALQAGDSVLARSIWDETDPPETRENQLVELALLAREADRARVEGLVAAADERDARFEAIVAALIDEDPTDVRAWSTRVSRFLQRSRIEGRADLLDQATQALEDARLAVDDPATLDPVRLEVLAARGNLEGLALELGRQLEERPGNDALRSRLVETYRTLDRTADAERILRDGIDRAGSNERSLPWRRQLAALQSSRGDHAGAAETYGRALELSGGTDTGLLRSWVQSLLAGDRPQVRRVSEILAAREADLTREPVLRAIYGRCLLMTGRDVPAEEQFVRALADIRSGIAAGTVRFTDTAAWTQQVVAGRSEDTTAAEARVRRLAGDRMDPWMLMSLAQTWATPEGGDPARGAELLAQAVAAVPEGGGGAGVQRSLLRKIRGGVLIEMGRPQEALEVFERALAETPQDPDLLNNTAFLQATLLDDPEPALPRALAAVARNPDNWAFLDTAGKICSLLGRWEDAESYLRRSMAARTVAGNTFHLAEVLAATDRRSEALQMLERASELLDPADDELRTEIDQLANELAGD